MTSNKTTQTQQLNKEPKASTHKYKSTYAEVDPFLIQYSRKRAKEAQEKEKNNEST